MKFPKNDFLIILSILLLSMKNDGNRRAMLCHHWVQFASKADMDAALKPVDPAIANELTLKGDSSYEQTSNSGQLKQAGKWFLNDDGSKMELTLLSLNGQSVPPFPEESHHYNIIILKLTADTLVYGNEFYRRKEGSQLVYNHSDQYFIRKD